MPVASIEIVPAGGSIEVGGTIQLRANVKGSQGSRLHGRAITWASSDNAVAAVSSGGLVSGLKAGTSTVTAASEGVTQTATISVRSTPSLVSWSDCRWIEVGAQKSHQKGENWLPDGYFITQIDLDGCGACGAHDSPVIGRVGICEMLGCRWSDCRWVEVGAQKSHHGGGNWLPDGYFITQLDLDGPKEYDAHDSPIIGRVRICKPKPRE
jgi:hypothetical protein